MNNLGDVVELFKLWLLRPITGRAALAFIGGGFLLLSPPLFIELGNSILSTSTDYSIPTFEAQPEFATLSFILGFILAILSYLESKRDFPKEVVGIRHQSLGSFPVEAIKPELSLSQRLRRYREINVDHSDSYSDGTLNDHRSLIKRIEKVPVELDSLLGEDSDTVVAYYGLTHIPMSFYLGYLLTDNKYKVQLFELNNDAERWNQLSGNSDQLNLINNKHELKPSGDNGDIVVTIGISYPVHQSEVDALDLINVLGNVHINAAYPMRQLITNHTQIEQICREFKTTLEHIKNTCPNRQRIHFFYSGPVSLSFALGRCISERIDSEVVIYNYSVKERPKYSWSLTINSPDSETAGFNKYSLEDEGHASVQYA